MNTTNIILNPWHIIIDVTSDRRSGPVVQRRVVYQGNMTTSTMTTVNSCSTCNQSPRFVRMWSIEEAAAKNNVLLQDVDAGAACLTCPDCPGFQLHVWRKICSHCRCPWEDHEIFNLDTDKFDTSDCFDEDGKSTRQLALEALLRRLEVLRHTQNPQHDSCRHLQFKLSNSRTDDQLARLQDRRRRSMRKVIVYPRNQHSCNDHNIQDNFYELYDLEPTFILPNSGSCHSCKNRLADSDTVTVAEVPSGEHIFHFDCFGCQQCKNPIVGPSYFVPDDCSDHSSDHRLCARCHVEQYYLRCAGCDELILDEVFTTAEDRAWHQDHFCCDICDEFLGGTKYTKMKDNRPVCLECYDTKLAPWCHTCSKPIRSRETLLEVGPRSFHGNENCFKDDNADEAVLLNDALYCTKHADELTAFAQPQCFVCNRSITDAHYKVKNKEVHTKCYRCMSCNVAFIDENGKRIQSAHIVGSRILCKEHASAILVQDFDA
eukprot:gene5790-7285_t